MLELEPSYTDGGNVNWCSCYGASLFLIAPKQKHLKMFINRWVDKLWYIDIGFPASSVSEESTHNEGDLDSIPGVRKIPRRRKWLPTPVFLPGESQWPQ